MTVANYFCVLNVSDAVEQLEQIAFGRVEREIAYVETRRRNFDRFRFTLWPRLPLLCLWLRLCRAIARATGCFPLGLAVAAKKCRKSLPECWFGGCFCSRVLMTAAAVAPSVGTASRTSRASPRWMRFHVSPQCLPNC